MYNNNDLNVLKKKVFKSYSAVFIKKNLKTKLNKIHVRKSYIRNLKSNLNRRDRIYI